MCTQATHTYMDTLAYQPEGIRLPYLGYIESPEALKAQPLVSNCSFAAKPCV